MIINSQRTIYGLECITNRLFGLPYTPRPNTTLNEKFLLNQTEVPGVDTNHTIKYLAIGVGGNPIAAVGNSYSYSEHGPLDAALFEQVPFIVRLVIDDITSVEQERYRFRVLETINGVEYVLYYLRIIPANDIKSDTYTIIPGVGSTATLTKLTTDTAAHINPVPRSVGYVLNANSEYVSKMVKIKFELTPTELAEITNGIDVLYGPNSDKTITEVGVCGGLDKVINGLTEAIHTQIYFHVSLNVDTKLEYAPSLGYLRAIELGGSESIYL